MNPLDYLKHVALTAGENVQKFFKGGGVEKAAAMEKSKIDAQLAKENSRVNAQGLAQPSQYQASDYSKSGSSVAGLQSSVGKLGYMQSNEAAKELQRLQPQQLQYANQLALGALGQGPSLANAQMQAANERTLAQQVGAARANRSINPALAQRNISNIAAQQNAQLAQNASMARLQEQQQQQNAFQNYLQNQQNQVLQQGQAGASAIGQAGATRAAAMQQQNALTGALISGAATVGGAMIGGPAGAAAGSQLGSAITGSQNMQGLQQPSGGYLSGKANGGKIEGKEVVKGDSPKNDIVPALLSAGEIVIPKSVVQKGSKSMYDFIKKIEKEDEPKKMNKGGKVSAGMLKSYKKGC